MDDQDGLDNYREGLLPTTRDEEREIIYNVQVTSHKGHLPTHQPPNDPTARAKPLYRPTRTPKMLTTPPTLHIKRPSPTTAEFTVSTKPCPTIPLRLLLSIVLLLRLALGTSVLLLLYTKWTQSPYATPYLPPPSPQPFWSESTIHHLLHTFTLSRPGIYLSRVAESTPPWALIPPCLLGLYLCILRIYKTESLLVLRGLGIQTASTGRTFLSGDLTRFIPTEKICDVLINEAFQGFGVVYYLVVVVDGEEDLVVVFPRLLPGRKVVERVWRGVRGCLYEGEEKG